MEDLKKQDSSNPVYYINYAHARIHTLFEKSQNSLDNFTKDFTKSEIVTTFQAILELLKYQFLRIKQEQTFGEITILLNPDRDEEAGLGTIDEYD